jgi:hypothetical protein
MFAKPSLIIGLQMDISQFSKLCSQYQYKPTTDEMKELINYLMLTQYSASGIMTESISNSTMNYLLESFEENYEALNERGSSGSVPIGDLDASSVFNAGASVIKKTTKATGGAFKYLMYLFTRGKAKAALQHIYDMHKKELEMFLDIADKKAQIAKLEGTELPGLSNLIPTWR